MADKKNEDAKSAAPAPKRSRLKRWLITVAVILVLCSGALGVAEYRTSQPEFCASCHNMEPYYQSWEVDVHGGKIQVACVECHYAPGERTTIKAKFRGLSQAASYFSGRYGASRPRAHVSNLSCMTAKCHGDLKFMDKPITFGTVKFLHANHLNRKEELEKPAALRLAKLQAELKTLLGDEHFAELEAVAQESGPGDARHSKLAALCKTWMVEASRDLLVEFTTLHHRQVRVDQLRDLQCTNCHAYSSPAKGAADNRSEHHFQVSTTTCFTCHFNNEGFNTGTNTCLMCHTPPQQEITVHAEVKGESGDKLGAKLVKMNHTELLAKKVDCVACHADTAREDSTVTRRDCERCHDQPRFFENYKEPFSLELVTSYHKVHIEQQRAKCLDCHSEIKHKLVQETPGDAGFLSSSLANCAECHPNHHAAQVDLLLGRGGVTVPKSTPNLMFGSRTNCSGCHTELASDPHGGNVTKATEAACIACHGDRHKDTFAKWKQGLELVLGDAETAYADARKKLDEATAASPAARAKAEKLLQEAQADLKMVKSGNGLHNITYAMELLDAVATRSQEAVAALEGN